MTSPQTLPGSSACGICGRPMDHRHGDDSHGGADKIGKRVEYIVVGKRGGIAQYRELGSDSKVRKTDAAMLALQLGVEEASLAGRRFTCWVEPAEYGSVSSDFRLVGN